jgi:site-specific DNA recombinase
MSPFKIAFYVRCSTEEQGLHANPEGTIKNQEQRLRYEVELKNRSLSFGEVVGVFVEDGLSAKDTKRPSLQRMLKAIELGEINLVMVTEFSRLSRNMRDFASMWELFKSYKCSVISLRENFDTSTAAGEMMLYNMANLAQYERRMTSERVIASRIDRARRGLFNGGIIPLGYKKGERPGYLERDEEKAQIIKLAFKKFLEIGTLLKTARWLNDHKVAPSLKIRGSGRSRLGYFTVSNLRFILTNKCYVGLVSYQSGSNKMEASAKWPNLIEEDDFLKVQKMLKENFRRKKPHQKNRYPYTLSGLVFCKKCGEVMCGKSAHGRTTKVGYYEHSWSMRKDAALAEKSFNCGMYRRVPAKIIENLVHQKIEEILLQEDVASQLIKDVQRIHANENKQNDLEKNLKRNIASYSAQLEFLSGRLASLPIDVPADEIYKVMKMISMKRESVKSELEGLISKTVLGQEIPVELKDYAHFLKAMKLMWFDPRSNSELKEKLIKKFVARIEIDIDEVLVEYWVGQGHFKREGKESKIFGSSTCQNGGSPAYRQQKRPVDGFDD